MVGVKKESQVSKLATRPWFRRWEGGKVTILGGEGGGSGRIHTEGEVWRNVDTPGEVGPKQEPSASALVTVGARYFLWCGGLPCSLDTNCTCPDLEQNQTCLQTLPNVLREEQASPVENHCVRSKLVRWRFTAARITTVKRWDQGKCPSPDGWVNRRWCIHILECYSATGMKKWCTLWRGRCLNTWC